MKRKILWCFGFLSEYDKNIILIEKLHSENVRLTEEIEDWHGKKTFLNRLIKDLRKRNKELQNELKLVV